MNTPETLRGWLETCDLLGEDPIVPKDDVLAHADAWEEDIGVAVAAEAQCERLRQRLEATERAQLEFVAMLCHNNGGEIRLMPVLLRGDEEVVMLDDPLTLERVYRIRSSALAAGESET